jgi:predicted nucleic acid-binding protein
VELSRFLKGCRIEALDELRARTAGAACAIAQTSDPIDASVAVGAIARGDLVVTSDDGDIRTLADALHSPIEIIRT